jgi:septum formation protein
MSAESGKAPLVLASTSPRRAMLLTQVGLPFVVIPPIAKELSPTDGDFVDIVMRNAETKARSVVGKADGRLVIGADTIVDLNGQPLNKPTDPDDARRMLSLLSGRSHRVHTGIVVIDSATGRLERDAATTRVYFRQLGADEINAYVQSGQPLDKAGSYGIQERGALFIERVEGCFFNVVGLPLAKLWEMLKRMGY